MRLSLALFLLAASAQAGAAQSFSAVGVRPLSDVAPQGAPRSTGAGAFALETLGGTVGSALGMIIVGVSADCDVEDLACLIKTIAGAGALGVVGATAGTLLVARRNGSPRSAAGAVLGAVAGTGVALGVHYLLDNNTDRNLDDAEFVIPLFAIGQGTFAAIGSRLLGRAGSD